jgi:hypothetical protein
MLTREQLSFGFMIVIGIVLCFLYGFLINVAKFPDILGKTITEKISGFDGWAVIHIMFYFIMGFVYPDQHMTILVIGIAWEFIETYFGQREFIIKSRKFKMSTSHGENETDPSSEIFWYGRITDVVYNTIGYVSGCWLYNKIKKNNEKKLIE